MKKILLLFAVCAICSCSGRFDEDAIRDTTSQFFTSIQSKNWTLANRIYPNFSKFASVHNFINYTVESMNYEKGKGVCVNVDLEYLTSRTAPASHYKVKFYFEKDKETKSYLIKDSESFAVFDRDAYNYKYAVITGCLDELKDVTDVMISDKLAMAQEMYNYYFEKIKTEVLPNVTTTKQKKYLFTDYNYSDAPRWYTICWKIENKSKYDLSGLKLKYTAPTLTYVNWKSGTMKIKTIKSGNHVVIESDGGECEGLPQTLELLVDDAVNNIIQVQTIYSGGEYEQYLQEVKETAKSE